MNAPDGSQNTPSEPRLLDQLRDRIRLKHYSIRTETQYVTQSALRAQVFPFASDKKCPRFESKWPGHRGSAYSQLKDAPLAARLAGAKG